MNNYKKMLAIILCLIVGSVINAGPKAIKDTAKAYAAMYGAYFSSGIIYATQNGRAIQKKFLEVAEINNDLRWKEILTRFGRGNPIYEANMLTFQHIARTIPRTLPAFVWSSVVYHAYKNADINF